MDFRICKDGWSDPKHSHLDREQYGKFEDRVDIKPGSTWTVDIKRGIFQGDSLSTLLFVIIMIPLSLILRDTRTGYQLKKEGCKIKQLPFMDDFKLYGLSI